MAFGTFFIFGYSNHPIPHQRSRLRYLWTTSPSLQNLPDQDSWLNRNLYDLNQLTDFARGTLSDSNSDGILDTVASPSRTQAWDLDAMGNWQSLSTNGTGQSRTHNAQNQVTGVGSASLTFDANGSMTADEAGRTFIYDAWNRLVAVRNSANSPIVTYSIDALGRRIIEDRPNANTVDHLYYSTGWQVLEERRDGTSSGDVRRQYFWSIDYVDALTARVDYASGAVSATYHAQYDANWNVTAIADASTGVLERYIYDPDGTATVLYANWSVRGGSPYGWNYLHQGGRLDVDSNLYHFRHRDYSAILGRWTQTDPIGFNGGDLNLFRYKGDSPGNAVDPSGLRKWYADKVERILGIWEIGPFDAYYVNKDVKWAAYNFSDQCYPQPKMGEEDKLGWPRNAARHAYVIARLSAEFDESTAWKVGLAHEFGNEEAESLDTWIDLYNNKKALEIGRRAYDKELRRYIKNTSWFSWACVNKEIEKSVKTALEDGTLITDPSDTRIPRKFWPVTGIKNSTDSGNSERKQDY